MGVEWSFAVPQLPQPYLLFLADLEEPAYAKTAYGLRDWAPEKCVGEFALTGCRASTGLPRLSPAEAYARGARGLVIAVAPIGGALAPAWIPALVEGMEAGLDLISGMHGHLVDIPLLACAAEQLGRRLVDVRTPPARIPIASARKRSGKRLLAVGTDCALGKKYTALALTRAFTARGVSADFRATGQTGILIAGAGIPMDAVVADFLAGAAEMLSPAADANHWDVVEGQGSIFHPSYAGVSLGLLHGTQPDVIVLCHEAGREAIVGLSDFALPTLAEAIELHLRMGRLTNPAMRCAGISLNTSRLSPARAAEHLRTCSLELGLPVADPIRGGPEFEALVDACLN